MPLFSVWHTDIQEVHVLLLTSGEIVQPHSCTTLETKASLTHLKCAQSKFVMTVNQLPDGLSAVHV